MRDASPSAVLVTGASGFLGRALVNGLRQRGQVVFGGSRKGAGTGLLKTPELDAAADWRPCLQGIGAVIHTAAHVHVFRRHHQLAEFRRINVEGTLKLARQAAGFGVRRFVFISTIGVNGTSSVRPFTEGDLSKPEDAYAISKWEAEQGLIEIGQQASMEIVILRPTMIYGRGAGGNFGFLTRAIAAGVPLPLGAFNNCRTLIGLRNMVELACVTLDHPAAANQLFLAGDSEAMAVAELCRMMAAILRKPDRLVSLPPLLVQRAAGLVGCRKRVHRLSTTLLVDSSKAMKLLGWQPKLSVMQGLTEALSPVRSSGLPRGIDDIE